MPEERDPIAVVCSGRSLHSSNGCCGYFIFEPHDQAALM